VHQHELVPEVQVTVHPSSLLRMRSRSGYQEAYAQFVEDLRMAGEALREE
jgi:hypothetical protein